MHKSVSKESARIEGWIRKLGKGRIEIFLKVERYFGVPDRKIRASGPRQDMYELVDWFEEKTGLRVDVPNRPHKGPKPMEGQTSFLMGERKSEDGAHADLP